MKKTAILAIAFTVLSGAVNTLQADVITDWQFSVNSTFTDWLGQNGYNAKDVQWWDAVSNTVAGISFNDDYTQMGWSSSDGRTSGLELDSHSGTITTDGVMETALTMTHNNATIGTGSPAPKIMEIAIDVLLFGTHEDGQTVEKSMTMNLLLGFIETPNANNKEKLAEHTEDDIFFIVSNPSTTQRFSDAYGNIYDVSMDAVFEEITGVHLDTALHYIDSRIGDYYDLGSFDTLYGWSTLEKTYQENAMDVNIVVRHETMPSTPEPATMLIFAVAGALGLPACRKWRKNARR